MNATTACVSRLPDFLQQAITMVDRTPAQMKSDRAIAEELDRIKQRVAQHMANMRQLDEVFRSRIDEDFEEYASAGETRRC